MKIHILVLKISFIFESRENVSYFNFTALLAVLVLIWYQICQYFPILICFSLKQFLQIMISKMRAVRRNHFFEWPYFCFSRWKISGNTKDYCSLIASTPATTIHMRTKVFVSTKHIKLIHSILMKTLMSRNCRFVHLNKSHQ